MVELGNHQGRPPGGQQPLLEMNSDLSSASLSSSLLDHWINQDIASLDFLDSLQRARTTDTSTYSDTVQNTSVVKEEQSDIGVLDSDKLFMLQMKDNSQLSTSLPHWGFTMDVDSLKLDDVFQVEQSDLVQSPTLAELNGEKEPFFELEFGDLDFDMPYILPDILKKESITKETVPKYVSSDAPLKTENECKPVVVKSEPTEMLVATAKEDFEVEQECRPPSVRGKVASSLPLAIPGVSVRQHRQRTFSSTELSVTSSVSSNDEGFGSQAEDTDAELQLASDAESLACDDDSQDESPKSPNGSTYSRSASGGTIPKNVKTSAHKKRYFWQYNIQSKGPKGPRLPLNGAQFLDPHVLNDVTDPVFSKECHLEGVKHAGKARRGDGNDLTPNPRKLHNIGVELKALNRMINDLSATCDSPGNIKPKSRKEKNKLASRSCRLKKKAQHEANKLKLFGLQQEHTLLMNVMREVKGVLLDMKCKSLPLRSCQQSLQRLLEKKSHPHVAGHTAEFVNSILDKVAAGQPVPGLDSVQN